MYIYIYINAQFHFQMSPLKAVASLNRYLLQPVDVLVTVDTSHFEMSPLKAVAPLNIPLTLATLDDQRRLIRPTHRWVHAGRWGRWGSRFAGTTSDMRTMALLSSGADMNVAVHNICHIDPAEPVKISIFLPQSLPKQLRGVYSARQSWCLNDFAWQNM